MPYRPFAAAVALIVAPATAAQVSTPLQPGETLLEVAATGEARVRPDTAAMTVGVVTTGETARDASDANARVVAAVIAAVRGAGVAERAVRTQQISLDPRFQRDPGGWQDNARIIGYVARNSLAVTIERLERAPDVIAAAYGAGANSVEGPNLSTADPTAGVAAAREAAVRNALAEAEAYARALGLRVGRVIRVSERGSSVSRDVVVYATQSVSAPPPPAPPPPTPFAAGELRRTLNVWVDFALTR